MKFTPVQCRRFFAATLILSGMIGVLVGLTGCSGDRDKAGSDTRPVRATPMVAAVNYPLAYFAERLGKDSIQVFYPISGNTDPAYWKPKQSEIRQFQEADILLLNGADYAKWVGRTTLSQSPMVNTSSGLKDRYIYESEAVVHSHGNDGAHSHGATASTIWLDPLLALEQAAQIRKALEGLKPGGIPGLSEAFQELSMDLHHLHAQLQKQFSKVQPTLFLASHPVYQYLARRYELNLKSLHWEPGQVLSSKDWERFDALHANHQARYMFWEDTPREETAKALQARGITPIVLRPCAGRPATGDFMSVMNQNLDHLRQALPSGSN